jgi:hypothetical protein
MSGDGRFVSREPYRRAKSRHRSRPRALGRHERSARHSPAPPARREEDRNTHAGVAGGSAVGLLRTAQLAPRVPCRQVPEKPGTGGGTRTRDLLSTNPCRGLRTKTPARHRSVSPALTSPRRSPRVALMAVSWNPAGTSPRGSSGATGGLGSIWRGWSEARASQAPRSPAAPRYRRRPPGGESGLPLGGAGQSRPAELSREGHDAVTLKARADVECGVCAFADNRQSEEWQCCAVSVRWAAFAQPAS